MEGKQKFKSLFDIISPSVTSSRIVQQASRANSGQVSLLV